MISSQLAMKLVVVVELLNCVQLFVTPGSSVHGISQAGILEWVAILLQGISLTQGSNQRLLHWQMDSLSLNTGETINLWFK